MIPEGNNSASEPVVFNTLPGRAPDPPLRWRRISHDGATHPLSEHQTRSTDERYEQSHA